MGHSVQDCSKRTLVYMGIFFIETVKKSPGIKILSLVIKLQKTIERNAIIELIAGAVAEILNIIVLRNFHDL